MGAQMQQGDAGLIRTYSGIWFNVINPNFEDIRIEDIAHALSNQCRFGGHCRRFYSVAQHSVQVSQLCRPEDALWGLLHDASEAYLSDVPRPLKHLAEFKAYRVAEERLQRCIVERFGLSAVQPDNVTAADDNALMEEMCSLMSVDASLLVSPQSESSISTIKPCLPVEAEKRFLARFHEL